jgi:GT2 family glycosyltransferase
MLSIITVTWNNKEMTEKCIESIKKYTDDYELIVVDNASEDGTAEYLKKQKGIKAIFNATNEGWIKGVNKGLAEAKGDYIVFMNNDIEVTPLWTERLKAHLTGWKNVGAVAPMAKNTAGAHNPYYYGRPVHDEVNWLVGFCIMIKREIYDKIGGLDERFGWGHSDDVDYCYRIKELGYKRVIARDCFVNHLGGESVQKRFSNLEYKEDLDKKHKMLCDKWGQKEMEAFIKIGPPQSGTIGLLHLDQVATPFAHSFQKMHTPNYTKVSVCQGMSGIAKVRSDVAKDMEGDWLLFLDSDMEFPPDTLNRLLSHNKDIVGGLCFRKVPPFNPTLYKKRKFKDDYMFVSEWPENQLIEVDATGCACLLIRRDVLEAIPDPIFEDAAVSEDMNFCKKAQKAGFKIYVDTGLKIGHVGQKTVYEDHFKSYNRDILQPIQSAPHIVFNN